MQYEKNNCSLFTKHLWKQGNVTMYVKEISSYYEMEIAIHQNGTTNTYRIGNTLDKETALQKTAAFLELFE